MPRVLEAFLHLLEWLTAVFLALLTLAAVGTFVVKLGTEVKARQLAQVSGVLELVSALLVFFVVIELFKMTLAYFQGRNIVPVVLETILVALARKVVVLEGGASTFLPSAVGLAALILATAIAWFLFARSRTFAET